jgi:hydrogenase maturation protease
VTHGFGEKRKTNNESLVIGIGNDFRGDDGAGLEVARRLRVAAVPGVTVREHGGDIASLIDAWDGFESVFVADAVSANARAGEVLRFDAHKTPIPRIFAPQVSSHGVGAADAIELAQALGRLPARMLVYGVAGSNFEIGTPISPAVLRGIDEVVAHILRDLEIPWHGGPSLERIIRDA